MGRSRPRLGMPARPPSPARRRCHSSGVGRRQDTPGAEGDPRECGTEARLFAAHARSAASAGICSPTMRAAKRTTATMMNASAADSWYVPLSGAKGLVPVARIAARSPARLLIVIVRSLAAGRCSSTSAGASPWSEPSTIVVVAAVGTLAADAAAKATITSSRRARSAPAGPIVHADGSSDGLRGRHDPSADRRRIIGGARIA